MMNIVITGASKGIGHALVRKFAAMGQIQILAISRNRIKISELAKDCSRQYPAAKVVACPFDLVNGDYQQLVSDYISPVFQPVDILVNNAGFLINKPFREISDEDFQQMFDVNIKAPFRLTRTLVPWMRKGGHVVNISSMGGVQGSAKFQGLSAYSSSKGALSVLTECLAEELKPEEIQVNCLALGSVQTEMLGEAFPGYQAPLEADEMAVLIADFAMKGNRFFNGKILPVSLTTP